MEFSGAPVPLLDENDPPSSASNDLASFRQHWIQELQDNLRIRSRDASASSSVHDSSQAERKTLARSLYQIGISEERAGNPFKAVNFYARACRMCPDIEQEFLKFHDSSKSSDTATPAAEEEEDSQGSSFLSSFAGIKLSSDSETPDEGNLLAICLPGDNFDSSRTHISKLPYEIMLLILRSVAFPDFDMKSVEYFGMVCKGFRHIARDADVWRRACLRVWGDAIPGEFTNLSWREMYLRRPRLNFHGVYISKVVYTRQGEQSFESCYNIFHTLEYYRYLRFFPDGLALMYTSPEEPKLVVPKLKYASCRLSGIKRGHFNLEENSVILILQDDERNHSARHARPSRNRTVEPFYENNFFMTLSISAAGRKKPSCKLSWVSYSVQTKKIFPLTLANGRTKLDEFGNVFPADVELGKITDFNINNKSQFQPFLFSLVRSYTAVPTL
ncbi:F-box only protein 9-like [Symsagittifera roscoffensis]|uniref:F-box only protein 9-like n=1 Tax=Symsagittifera roscoffensis TaxID=84072 RepID=UPI00307BFEA9